MPKTKTTTLQPVDAAALLAKVGFSRIMGVWGTATF